MLLQCLLFSFPLFKILLQLTCSTCTSGAPGSTTTSLSALEDADTDSLLVDDAVACSSTTPTSLAAEASGSLLVGLVVGWVDVDDDYGLLLGGLIVSWVDEGAGLLLVGSVVGWVDVDAEKVGWLTHE